MGNLLPAGALGRQLQWSDFTTRTLKNPSTGGATAAETRAAANVTPKNFTFSRAKFLRPPNFTLDQDPGVVITFNNSTSWVASWVFTNNPKTFQDSLLQHEQGHYDIVALNGGDMFVTIQGIGISAFSSAQAGLAELKRAFALVGTQPIHDRYDVDTSHGLNSARQAVWVAAIADARSPGQTLRGSLRAAGLFP